jgi:hypothetical protein
VPRRREHLFRRSGGCLREIELNRTTIGIRFVCGQRFVSLYVNNANAQL